MYSYQVFVSKTNESQKGITAKDIVAYRRRHNLTLFMDILFLPPDYHIGIMTFPGVETDKYRSRSQQMNYEAFINTMAEFMQKYRE